MITLNVAPGVHRVEDSYVNWYIVDEGRDLTLIDAGLPRSWASLQQALTHLHRRLSDIRAVVLTHGHFDHVGIAERLRVEQGVDVWAHERELPITQHPLSYEHEKSRLRYAWRPGTMAVMASFMAWGMLNVDPIGQIRTYVDGQVLDVPGRPKVLFTPGHTVGHCSLLLEERGVLLAGDAVVLHDPYTRRTGPRLVARAATADTHLAHQSLDKLRHTNAQTVLTGHGEPWMGPITELIDQASTAGSA